MDNFQYLIEYPNEPKSSYTQYNPVDIQVDIPDGLEAIVGSFYLAFDYRYSIANNQVGAADAVFFDNYAGSACFFDNLKLEIENSSIGAETNMPYYSQGIANKRRLMSSVDELSTQTRHSLEMRCADLRQTREFLRTNAFANANAGWESAIHYLDLGLNNMNRNFNAQDVGRIKLSFQVKDRTLAFTGEHVSIANSLFELRNLRLVYRAKQAEAKGLLTMETMTYSRYDLVSANVNIEHILEKPASSVSGYFSTPALIAGVPAQGQNPAIPGNSMGSVRPTINELTFLFDGNNYEKLSYTLKDDIEILRNYQYAVLGDGMGDTNCFTGPRLNSAAQSTYGIGIAFDQLLPAGKKVNINLISSFNNANPGYLYLFTKNLVLLKSGEASVSVPRSLTGAMPLEFGQKGDKLQTNELTPMYHSAQRTEFHFPKDATVSPDLRLVKVSVGANGEMQWATGLGGAIDEIFLYDGDILLSGVNRSQAKMMYGFNKLISKNSKSNDLRYKLDGSRWGFTNRDNNPTSNICPIAYKDDKPGQLGSILGYLELKDFIPILSQCQYLRFRELKVVIHWKQSAQDVIVGPYPLNIILNIQAYPPTMIYDRITPDRPYSEVKFWDIESDSLVYPAITAQANPNLGIPQKSLNQIQGFNGKTLNNMLIMNQEGGQVNLGDFQSRPQYNEKYRWSDDSQDLPVWKRDMFPIEAQAQLLETYGSLNVPALSDKLQLATPANILGGSVGNTQYHMAWKGVNFNGYKPKKLSLEYTRSASANGQDLAQLNQTFHAQVLKLITFDQENRAVVSYI